MMEEMDTLLSAKQGDDDNKRVYCSENADKTGDEREDNRGTQGGSSRVPGPRVKTLLS